MQTDQLSRDLERTLGRFGVMVRAVGRRSGLDEADLDELMQAVRVRLWRALGREGALPVHVQQGPRPTMRHRGPSRRGERKPHE